MFIGPGVTVAEVAEAGGSALPSGTNWGPDVSWLNWLSVGVYEGESQTSFAWLFSPDLLTSLGHLFSGDLAMDTFSVVPLLGGWIADGESETVYGFSFDLGMDLRLRAKRKLFEQSRLNSDVVGDVPLRDCSHLPIVLLRLGFLWSDTTEASVVFGRFGLVWVR